MINLRDKLGRFKSFKINLLDGQKRGEVIFRRVFLLVVLYLIVYLGGRLLIEKPEVKRTQETNASEELKDGDIRNGYEVSIDEDGKVWYIVPNEDVGLGNVEQENSLNIDPAIIEFTQSYPGSRIDKEYLSLLSNYCEEDVLKVVIAISVAESSMGRNTTRNSNFWGWFKGGNRNYDPDRNTMAQEICRGIGSNYMNIGVNRSVTARYTGNDRVDTWTRNFNWAINNL